MYTSDYTVNSKISLCEGDKTKLNIDCIINAGTETLEEDIATQNCWARHIESL